MVATYIWNAKKKRIFTWRKSIKGTLYMDLPEKMEYVNFKLKK